MIVITSKKAGFRRCGIAHSAAPTTYPDDKFSEEELAALRSESMLVIAVAEDDERTKEPKVDKKAKDK